MSVYDRLIFQPKFTHKEAGYTPAKAGMAWEDVYFPTDDGIRLNGWFLPSRNAVAALLYCHGNAGNLCDWVDAALPFVLNRVSVFMFDYRGYGRSQGKPSEKGLYLDGQAAWQWLKEKAANSELPIFILGKSIGSAVASHIAKLNKPAGLVLDSAFTSLAAVVAHLAPWLPKILLPKSFQSLEIAQRISCPTLVIHGGADRLVPLEQGDELYRALTCPKVFKVVPQADHTNIDSFRAYSDWIIDFVHNPLGFIDRSS